MNKAEDSTFVVPDRKIIGAWNAAEPIDDETLALVLRFFSQMVAGCEALGERYSLATMALRSELDSVTRVARHRRMT